MKKYLPIILLLLLLPFPAYAWPGKVVGVTDGDTIKVLSEDSLEVKVRLYGIDAPEKGQPYGQAAGKYLAGYVAGESVDIETMDIDRYGRIVGLVFRENLNINEEMLKAGYAWVFIKYCKASFCDKWNLLEENSRNAKQGIWKEPAPAPPWEWRRKLPR